MSTTAKIVIVIVVLAIIGYVIFHKKPSDQVMGNHMNSEPALTTASNDNSDEALNKDMSSVDAQMSGLNSDNSNADAGLSQSNQ